MFKIVILGIIFIVVFLAFYLTIWKKLLKPDEPTQNDVKTNIIKKSETTKEGNE